MKQSLTIPNARFTPSCPAARTWLVLCAIVLGSSPFLVWSENTNSMIKPPVPLPGGLGLHPVITSITRTQDLVTVEWFGLQGPFQVLRSLDAQSTRWLRLEKPTFGNTLNVPVSGETGFFRVLSGRPVSDEQTGGTLNYLGAETCALCHADAHDAWRETGHAKALESLKVVGQQNNATCLVCHTVGFGTPLGFKNEQTTPHLAGVQCESCHGPGGGHVANLRDPSARPKVTIAAEVCGGCHNGFHHATYDEWKQSKHSAVNPEVSLTTLERGEPRMLSCGPCHSGAVRTALLNRLENPVALLPSREDAAYFGLTCAVCHDPHTKTGNASNLRNPTYSLHNFSYSTATNTSFAAQYDPSIQACGQCHNMRGARWQDTSRPPHYSPQYNILVGQGAYDLGKPMIAAHGLDLEKQCAHCHTHPHDPDPVTQESSKYTGHDFNVSFEGCAECHRSVSNAQRATANTQRAIKAKIEEIRTLLDQWAMNKAPTELRAKYGRLTWEYNIPGELSNPANDSTLRGPTTAEQAQVPNGIKQARLNLYLVQHDGSFGVHNGTYARYLLDVARTNVNAELSQP